MCLAVLALNALPGLPVLIAANRDEFHARPAAPAAAWPSGIYAGRDLLAGGTWMGAARNGHYAILTNYREVGRHLPDAPSRGKLAEHFLAGDLPARDYIASVAREGGRYNGFNLIVGDRQDAWYYGNRGGEPRLLKDELYALSNHLLDSPWPKSLRLKHAVRQTFEHGLDLPALFAALGDRTVAEDASLPDTGLPRERERLLSSPFIVSADYGTRCSTVLLWRANGQGELVERRFDSAARLTGETALHFHLPGTVS
ncbi:NRDE family protein [Bordetella avium]|uniref:NRDE family protein n=1 Tax=Bordetella avium TaxID=521 RepID=UPI000FDA87F5|nr:NRDE family protein [Bordetella avium]AZY52695.1 hypothetical protein C0J07_09425 [Bordetella avium]